MYIQSCSPLSVLDQIDGSNVYTLPSKDDCVNIPTPYIHRGTTHFAFVRAISDTHSAISEIAYLHIRKYYIHTAINTLTVTFGMKECMPGITRI